MQILPKIKSPSDVKRLNEGCLDALAEEIRQTIIETTSENGGHLASNLGMVEATIALHRVFDCPRDAFVFDVSHQAYTHKLLTGRYDRFSSLRRSEGLSGFTNREESEYDLVTAGHSGSAISTAIGMAEANRLSGKSAWVIAVVGDGSFTNGMVYEALNQLAARDIRLIIMLNDNEMSISKNVGGLSKYLEYIRISQGYFNFKYHAKRVMNRIPYVGEGMISAARFVRDVIKRMTNSETWFESFGLKYIGTANGNNIQQMITVLKEARSKNCPVIVHIKTKKGLGFAPSEEHPENYHSVGKFSLDESDTISNATTQTTAFTDIVGDELVHEAELNKKICTITAAMTDGCGLAEFERRFPERFFDVGIAEEHEITMAGGLSLGGMLPVAVLYSTFAQRTFDQLWHDITLQKTQAILLLSHCGIVPGDGVTHQGIYDVSLFSSLEDSLILSPDTYDEWRKSFKEACGYPYLSIIRYPKGIEAKYPSDVCWNVRKAYKFCEIGGGGKDFLLLTYGRIAENVVKAALEVSENHNDMRFTVVVLRQIKPIPLTDELAEVISQTEKVLFVEEGVRSGGVGEAIAADDRVMRKITIHAITDTRIPHGDYEYLMKFCGLDAKSIKEKIISQINNKSDCSQMKK